MHINAKNGVKYINNSIGWYYASKFIQWNNIYILDICQQYIFSVFL